MQWCKCGNPSCSQRTFSERIEALAATGRSRTTRLAETLRALGYALGGQAAARLAARLDMRISGPTVLRELRRAGCTSPTVVSAVIGIDDWALARGQGDVDFGLKLGVCGRTRQHDGTLQGSGVVLQV